MKRLCRARIILEMDPDTPVDYLEDFIQFLKGFRFVEDAYLDVRARPAEKPIRNSI